MQQGAAWRPALFICDGVDAPATLIFGYPTASGEAAVAKLAGGGWSSQLVTVGAGEPGAGQINYPLSGSARGVVNAFNPAMVDGATSPAVRSVRLGGEAVTCRWAPGTVLLAVTPARTIQITATNPGYQYQAFTRGQLSPVMRDGPAVGNEPALSLNGGTMRGDAVSQTYTFGNGDYSYVVAIGGPQGKPGGTLTVTKAGAQIAVEQFSAYTLNGN